VVLDIVAKRIRNEFSEMECQSHKYDTKISKELSDQSEPDTLQRLLGKLSLDEQCLTSLLVDNIITSVREKHSTPLQISLEVCFHKKKTITHMHDYLVGCSYVELACYRG
jgi:hypothetical protein